MATMKLVNAAIASLLLLSISSISNAQVFDIMKYGAKADSVSNIDQVIISVINFLLIL